MSNSRSTKEQNQMDRRARRSVLSWLFSLPLFVWLFVILLIAPILAAFRPYNDTDDAVNGNRSGMALYTDNLTGCQYLKAGFFGELTPRRDGKGTHVGCK